MGAASRTPAVSATALGRTYGNVVALEGLDLQVDPGECVVVLGHNGSGKTTALQCIAGLLSPSAGSVRVAGADPFREPEAVRVRAALAFVADAPVFYRDLTVAEHLHLVGVAHGLTEAMDERDWFARIDGVLEEFGLTGYGDRLPGQLSSGLRQRAQLACAFVRPFEVAVLDEPVLRLDPAAQAALTRRLRAVVGDGASVLLTTHAPGFARLVADHVVVLEQGRVAAAGDWSTVATSEAAGRLGLR